MGIELKVANMSSPFIRENRHSDVDISVSNLKWYGPAVDIKVIINYIEPDSPRMAQPAKEKPT